MSCLEEFIMRHPLLVRLLRCGNYEQAERHLWIVRAVVGRDIHARVEDLVFLGEIKLIRQPRYCAALAMFIFNF